MRRLLFSSVLASLLFLVGLPVRAADAEPCAASDTRSGNSFAVTGSDELRANPKPSAARLVNQKATAMFGKKMFMTIDNSTTVVEECSRDGWSRVRVAEPEWLRETHVGWVRSSALRGRQKDASGQQLFSDADFTWDKRTGPHKKIIIAGVNKVHRENERCKHIDPSSAYISSDKGTRSNPVFYVTCGKGAGTFNAFFSKSDVDSGRVLGASQHIDQSRAVDLCEQSVRARAAHPSTVKFSRVLGLAVVEHPNGRTSVESSFEAKNSFNMELKYRARCLFDASGLIEANINEAQR